MARKKRPLTLRKKKKPKPKEVYAVRGLLDERTNEKGVREYLCDWEPDENGNEYPPEWIVEENVGTAALDEWEELKEQKKREGDSTVLPALRPQRDTKRQRELSLASDEEPHSPKKRQRRETGVEVALPANPSFDPREFVPIASGAAASQTTTIPDSQEQPESFPSARATVCGGESHDRLRSSSPAASDPPEPTQSHTEQATSGPLVVSSFGERQVVTADNSLGSNHAPQEVSQVDTPSTRSRSPPPLEGFLTQPDFQFDSQPQLLSSSSAANESGQVIADSNDKSTLAENQEQQSTGPVAQSQNQSVSQSAQVVLPLSSRSDELRTPSQVDALDNQGGIVPASSLSQIPQADLRIPSGASTQLSALPSDAIVCDTPERRTHSEARIDPSERHNISLTEDRVEPRTGRDLTPAPERAIAIEQSSPGSSILRQEQTSPTPSANGRAGPATLEQQSTHEGNTASTSPSPAPHSISNMDGTGHPPFGGGYPEDREESMESWVKKHHAETVGSLDRHRSRSPPNNPELGKQTDGPAPGNGVVEDEEMSFEEWTKKHHAETVGSVPRYQPRSPSNSNAAEPHTGEVGSVDLDAAAYQNPIRETAALIQPPRSPILDQNALGNLLNVGTTPGASLPMEEEPQHLPATITPSQMFLAGSSFHTSLPLVSQPLFQSQEVEREPEPVLQGIDSRQPSVVPEAESSPSSPSVDGRPNEFLVTLPMLSSTRHLYTETILSGKSAINRYSSFFMSESAGNPDDQSIAAVDDIFQRLHDHCDLPQYSDSMPALSDEASMKHATGTNTKFSFVYELLKDLKDSDSNARVLVLLQPGVASDSLLAIYETGQFNDVGLEEFSAKGDPNWEGPLVIHGTTDMVLSSLSASAEAEADVVILFDSEARRVWRDRPSNAIILSLVVTNSIEHIDLQLPRNLDELERRSALGYALATSTKYISHPEPTKEPNELAILFADFIKHPAHDLDWEPASIPTQIFDFYLSSQVLETQRSAATSLPNGRKRVLDGEERLSTPSKRVRTTHDQQSSYLMSDLLKGVLASYTARPGGSSRTVEVAIDQLEWMASKTSRLEEEASKRSKTEDDLKQLIKRTEQELEGYKKTVNNLEPKFKQAVGDRGVFEIAKNAAEARAAKLEAELSKVRAELQVLHEKLTTRNPTELEAENEALKAENTKLQKKVQGEIKEKDFFRERAQEQMGVTTELTREVAALRAEVENLERKASEVTARVHETNKRNSDEEVKRLIEESNAIIQQREQQLDRALKEQQSMRSNRRETRASSVPRSPRLGVMSPRARVGGNTSRGNSPAPFDGSSTPSSAAAGPVPGITFYQPPGHARFSHLRE